jgi:hypothetical protein
LSLVNCFSRTLPSYFFGQIFLVSILFPYPLVTKCRCVKKHASRNLCPRHNAPSTDDVVSVTSEESLAIGRPGKGDTLGLPALLANGAELGLELINLGLLLEIEDDDAAGGGGAEPVSVGGEDEGVDLVVGVERVQVLGLVKIPEHGGAVLATRGAEGTVGGDGDGVDVAGVADVVGLQLAAGELPDLFGSCLLAELFAALLLTMPRSELLGGVSFFQPHGTRGVKSGKGE